MKRHRNNKEFVLSMLMLAAPVESLPAGEWCERNINLGSDPTSPAEYQRFELRRTPHLREPLDFWSRDGGGKMTVMGIEQKGKSTIWKFGLLYRLVNHPEPMLIVYPSEEMGIDENRDSLEPLMRSIPELREALEQPFAAARNCYRLGRGRIYFEGAGNAVISRRAGVVIGDEISSWVIHEERVDNVKRLDHRIRQFRDGRRVLVCSPIGQNCLISREFKKSSMGYWTLRCRGCGDLAIRSCDISGKYIDGERRGGLQFEIEETDQHEKRAIGETIRLTCPDCGHEHSERDAAKMNNEGGYVHRYPDLIPLHAGYQFGALCNIPEHFPNLSWLEIANAQLRAGSSGTLSEQMNFDNSYRGLWYRQRKHAQGTDGDFDLILRQHIGDTPERLLFRVLAVDTQDDKFYFLIRGFDEMGNSYRLDYGTCEELEDVVRKLGQSIHGEPPVIGLQDVKGHREKEVVPYLKRVHGMLMYRGTGAIRSGRQYVKWKRSSARSKIYYVNARAYQAELLYRIYTQLDREKPYWYLPPEIGADYAHHILSLQPNERKRDGDQFENYEAVGKEDHWFDCEKMCIVASEIVQAWMSRNRTREIRDPKPLRSVFDTDKPKRSGRKQRIRNYD